MFNGLPSSIISDPSAAAPFAIEAASARYRSCPDLRTPPTDEKVNDPAIFSPCLHDARRYDSECRNSLPCGCSSVVERHVANVNVVGSSPITRSLSYELIRVCDEDQKCKSGLVCFGQNRADVADPRSPGQ